MGTNFECSRVDPRKSKVSAGIPILAIKVSSSSLNKRVLTEVFFLYLNTCQILRQNLALFLFTNDFCMHCMFEEEKNLVKSENYIFLENVRFQALTYRVSKLVVDMVVKLHPEKKNYPIVNEPPMNFSPVC